MDDPDDKEGNDHENDENDEEDDDEDVVHSYEDNLQITNYRHKIFKDKK